MSINDPLPVTNVEADPRKPWKALAAFVASTLLLLIRDYFAGNNELGWEGFLVSVGGGLVTALLTYVTRNPKIVTTEP